MIRINKLTGITKFTPNIWMAYNSQQSRSWSDCSLVWSESAMLATFIHTFPDEQIDQPIIEMADISKYFR